MLVTRAASRDYHDTHEPRQDTTERIDRRSDHIINTLLGEVKN